VDQAPSSLVSWKSQQIVIWLGDSKDMVRYRLPGESLKPSCSIGGFVAQFTPAKLTGLRMHRGSDESIEASLTVDHVTGLEQFGLDGNLPFARHPVHGNRIQVEPRS
jgi:hypothetical protein